jgi:hypothetical protein
MAVNIVAEAGVVLWADVADSVASRSGSITQGSTRVPSENRSLGRERTVSSKGLGRTTPLFYQQSTGATQSTITSWSHPRTFAPSHSALLTPCDCTSG